MESIKELTVRLIAFFLLGWSVAMGVLLAATIFGII